MAPDASSLPAPKRSRRSRQSRATAGGTDATPEEARAHLWSLGRLRWKLFPDQWPAYDAIWRFLDGKGSDADARIFVLNICRQWGKTFLFCLVAVEYALRNPGVQIRFVSDTGRSLRKRVLPNMRTVLEDCPQELRPEWRFSDGMLFFPAGESEIHLAGANNGHADDSRGQRSHLNVVDEAGFVDDLDYLVSSVLLPQTLTTGGRTILVSTPPVTPAHDFVTYMRRAESRGAYVHLTIDDNKHVSEREKAAQLEEVGGRDSPKARREYFGEIIVDQERAIVPEFTASRASRIVQPVPSPTHEFRIVSIDVGFEDLLPILFGYWDFKGARLVVQREVVLHRATTDKVAEAIRETEKAIWNGRWSDRITRWSDTDLRLIADLTELHGLGVQPTAKDAKEAQVNALRMLVKDEKIAIDPSCVTLIDHLKSGVWNAARTQFARTKTHGHFDCVAALIYMLRNAPRYDNPFPAIPDGFDPASQVISRGHLREHTETGETFKGIFRIKGARR